MIPRKSLCWSPKNAHVDGVELLGDANFADVWVKSAHHRLISIAWNDFRGRMANVGGEKEHFNGRHRCAQRWRLTDTNKNSIEWTGRIESNVVKTFNEYCHHARHTWENHANRPRSVQNPFTIVHCLMIENRGSTHLARFFRKRFWSPR